MTYRETLRPPTRYLALAAALAASFGLILLPLSSALAGIVALVLAAAVVIVLIAASPRIEIEGTQLRAGSAQIDARFLGDVTALGKEETRAAFGPESDLRAWSLHRSFAQGSVRVEIVDPRDPTPYWLVCTNHPAEFAEALERITP